MAEIAADGPMTADMDVPEDVLTLITDLHDGSWFCIGARGEAVTSKTGGL